MLLWKPNEKIKITEYETTNHSDIIMVQIKLENFIFYMVLTYISTNDDSRNT